MPKTFACGMLVSALNPISIFIVLAYINLQGCNQIVFLIFITISCNSQPFLLINYFLGILFWEFIILVFIINHFIRFHFIKFNFAFLWMHLLILILMIFFFFFPLINYLNRFWIVSFSRSLFFKPFLIPFRTINHHI